MAPSYGSPNQTITIALYTPEFGSTSGEQCRCRMLDTNIEPNNPYDQNITDRLYGGDMDMRIHQEVCCRWSTDAEGAGAKVTAHERGRRVLALERIRILIQEEGLHFDERSLDLASVASSNIFTTARASWDATSFLQ